MPRRSTLTPLQRRVLGFPGVWSEDVAEVLGESVFDVRDARTALGLCPQTGDPEQAELNERMRRHREDDSFESLDALMRTNRSLCG